MSDKTFEEKIAEIGVRQFVRNKMVAALVEFSKSDQGVEEFIDRLNFDILMDFRKLAKDESNKFMSQAKELLKKNGNL